MTDEKPQETLKQLLDPLTDNTPTQPIKKAVNVGLIVLSAYFAWILFVEARYIYRFVSVEGLEPDISVLLAGLFILYVIVTLPLLWKRNTWGWQLLVGCNILIFLGILVHVGWYEQSDILHPRNYLAMLLRVVLTCLAFTGRVRALFLVDKKAVTNMLGAVTVISVLIAMYDLFIFSWIAVMAY